MEAIVAVYSDWGIGANGTQPVVIKADRKHFQQITKNATVIVGRKTLNDFPGSKPLKNRINIVVTRQNITIEDAIIAHTVDEAIKLSENYERCIVIGGASIYKDFFNYLDKVHITYIDYAIESDVYFPNLESLSEWSCTDDNGWEEEDGIRYKFMTYERIN